MNDPFETFCVRFNDRATFNLAVSILSNSTHFDGFFHDVGHADMMITFADKNVMDDFVGELAVHQIWGESSFKGMPDFSIA